MIEPAFPTDADRRRLVALRATALSRMLVPMNFVSDEEKIRLLQELKDMAQHSASLALPIDSRIRTELVRFIMDPDPGTPGWDDPELMQRATDLRDILQADGWPLPWYAVPGQVLDAQDREDLNRFADAAAQVFRAHDAAAFLRLCAGGPDGLARAGRWFERRVLDESVDARASTDFEPELRFDGRLAILGSLERPAIWLVVRDTGEESPVDLAVGRTEQGWRSAWV